MIPRNHPLSRFKRNTRSRSANWTNWSGNVRSATRRSAMMGRAVQQPMIVPVHIPGAAQSNCDALCVMLSILLSFVAVAIVGVGCYYAFRDNKNKKTEESKTVSVLSDLVHKLVDDKTKNTAESLTNRVESSLSFFIPETDGVEDNRPWHAKLLSTLYTGGKFVVIMGVTYGLLYWGWFSIHSACDYKAGSHAHRKEVKQEDKGWFWKTSDFFFDNWVFNPIFKKFDNVWSKLFGSEKDLLCTSYTEFGGSEIGRAVFDFPLRRLHGESLTTQPELQNAWNETYLGKLTALDDAPPKDAWKVDYETSRKSWEENWFTQVGSAAVSFFSGYWILKRFYPKYATKFLSGLIGVGIAWAEWENRKFGAVSWLVGGGFIAGSWLIPGLGPTVTAGLTAAGAGAQNVGTWYNPQLGVVVQNAQSVLGGQNVQTLQAIAKGAHPSQNGKK